MVREIFAYWDGKRGDREMPRRCDIDPLDFPRHLPNIILVDVRPEPPHYFYRLVGTAEVATRGWNPTGKDVASHFFGPSKADVLASYDYVRHNRSFLFDPHPFVSRDGRFVHSETLFLPLSEDGATVSQVLIFAMARHL